MPVIPSTPPDSPPRPATPNLASQVDTADVVCPAASTENLAALEQIGNSLDAGRLAAAGYGKVWVAIQLKDGDIVAGSNDIISLNSEMRERFGQLYQQVVTITGPYRKQDG